MRCCGASSEPSRSDPHDGALRRAGAAVDVDAGGRPDRGAHLCQRYRRSSPVQIIEAGWSAFRDDAEEVSIRRDRYTGRISKIGDASVRTALYQAAHIMLTNRSRAVRIKSWAMRIAKRAGMSKAKVALARKLAVIMHRMLADGTPFNAAAAAPNRREITVFGRVTTPGLPEAKSLRRDDGSGQAVAHQVAHVSTHRRLADLSSSTPSGGGPAPTPYRSESPASGRRKRD